MLVLSLSILLAGFGMTCLAGAIFLRSKREKSLQSKLQVVRMWLLESTKLLTPEQYALYEQRELECLYKVGVS